MSSIVNVFCRSCGLIPTFDGPSPRRRPKESTPWSSGVSDASAGTDRIPESIGSLHPGDIFERIRSTVPVHVMILVSRFNRISQEDHASVTHQDGGATLMPTECGPDCFPLGTE